MYKLNQKDAERCTKTKSLKSSRSSSIYWTFITYSWDKIIIQRNECDVTCLTNIISETSKNGKEKTGN